MTSGPFSTRSARWLVAIGAVSLLASGVLAVFGSEISDVTSFGADSFSRSAIGHRAFVELLRELGFQVLVSRHATAARATGTTVVVLAEPLVGPDGPRRGTLEGIARRSPRLLVVLPKRLGHPSPWRPLWISGADLLPVDAPQRVLDALFSPERDEEEASGAQVVRPKEAHAWQGDLPTPEIEAPQLVRSALLAPLLSTPEGILAGELREKGRHVVVLADPDVFATHGLGRGANGVLAVRLLERLAGRGQVVLLDETLHGHELEPSLARELLRFPIVMATLHAILVAALLAWAALVRFGRPRRPPSPLEPGKAFLIQNTAGLLRYGGHVAEALAIYWRAAKDQLASLLRAPGERAGARDEWLARVAAARGRGEDLAALERRVANLSTRPGAEHEALQIALAIHRFREELTDGAGSHSRAD